MDIKMGFQRGLYFEEFEVGQKIVSAGRTITESDVVNFAGLSGDYNQIHTDAEYSKTSLAGQRIAHGLLVLSDAVGLAMRTGLLEGTVIVFREILNWKFIKPVYFGDTIHVVMSVVETKALPRLKGGLVNIEAEVINQGDVVVMKGIWSVLMASKPD
jgi:3-hydroxybutyryl-CoA dehydratase